MTRRQLAKQLSKRTLLNIKESDQVIEELFDLISEKIVEEKEIIITGFGKFYAYQHSPRPVRNPKTKEEMMLKPYYSLKFKPSDVVKKLLKTKE